RGAPPSPRRDDEPHGGPRHPRPQPRLAPRRPPPRPRRRPGARHRPAGRDPPPRPPRAPLPRPLRRRPRRRAAGHRAGPRRSRGMSVPFGPPRKGPRVALLLLLALWLVTLLGAPLVGSQAISLPRILHGDPTAASIFWQIRLPRVLLSLLGGAALAVSGLGFQTLFRNSLA